MQEFTLTPDQFTRLEKQLIDSHQVVLKMADGSTTQGMIESTDGRIAANFTFFPAGNSLEVTLTKHLGYFSFVAEAGLRSKLNAAIKAL